MKLRLEYFALLKDQRGQADETLDSEAATPQGLYAELKERHGFTLEPESLKVAVNEEFVDWDTRLSEGDTVVFIPPVAGG